MSTAAHKDHRSSHQRMRVCKQKVSCAMLLLLLPATPPSVNRESRIKHAEDTNNNTNRTQLNAGNEIASRKNYKLKSSKDQSSH